MAYVLIVIRLITVTRMLPGAGALCVVGRPIDVK